jgi:CRP-like cAMP-binding protein
MRNEAAGDTLTRQGEGNQILAALPPEERAIVRSHARLIHIPAGESLIGPSEPISAVFLPERGVITYVNALSTGQSAAVAMVGREGVVGAAVVLRVSRTMPWVWALVQVDASGYSVPADTFVTLFHQMRPLRELALQHFGRLFVDISRSAVCNRFHSLRQRLAWWLIELSRKSGQSSLLLTHDAVAQIVGGPRHAVTTALGELRALGAIEHLRGHLTVVDEGRLRMYACDCCEPA